MAVRRVSGHDGAMAPRFSVLVRVWPAAAALALAACGGGSVAEPAATSSTTVVLTTTVAPVTTVALTVTTTETTVSQEELDRAEIEDVGQRFFAFTRTNGFIAGRPGLDQVATSPIYDRMLETGNDFAAKGYGLGEGETGLTILEIDIQADQRSATVQVCRLDEIPLVDANGNELTERTPGAFLNEVDVVQVPESGWRVEEFRFKDDEATPCDL